MRPLRNPAVQATLAWLLANWLRLCFATMRWTEEDRAAAEGVWAMAGGGPGTGVVVLFWHSRIALAPHAWPLNRAEAGTCQRPRALISLSQDGEFIARAVDRLGFPAIRGSSAKKSAPDKAKGGAIAFRDGLRWVREGNCIAITPDGPRGPAEVMAEGAPLLGKAAPAPALLLGLACRPAIQLDSWDQAIVPLPFARGAVVWARRDYPADAPPGEVAAAWGDDLKALTARAEALVA